jgi:hypothetical protein
MRDVPFYHPLSCRSARRGYLRLRRCGRAPTVRFLWPSSCKRSSPRAPWLCPTLRSGPELLDCSARISPSHMQNHSKRQRSLSAYGRFGPDLHLPVNGSGCCPAPVAIRTTTAQEQSALASSSRRRAPSSNRFAVLSIIGWHAGECIQDIVQRKRSDIERAGRTIWLYQSRKAPINDDPAIRTSLSEPACNLLGRQCVSYKRCVACT